MLQKKVFKANFTILKLAFIQSLNVFYSFIKLITFVKNIYVQYSPLHDTVNKIITFLVNSKNELQKLEK